MLHLSHFALQNKLQTISWYLGTNLSSVFFDTHLTENSSVLISSLLTPVLTFYIHPTASGMLFWISITLWSLGAMHLNLHYPPGILAVFTRLNCLRQKNRCCSRRWHLSKVSVMFSHFLPLTLGPPLVPIGHLASLNTIGTHQGCKHKRMDTDFLLFHVNKFRSGCTNLWMH